MPCFIAIDPGNLKSAFVCYDEAYILDFGILPNEALRLKLIAIQYDLAIEMVASYGMAVGAEVFETTYWIGRFSEAAIGVGRSVTRIFRRTIKLHLCGVANAKDSNIRQALLDRYGPGKQKAMGTKKTPGPLYGISKDVWSALAVAVTHADAQRQIPHHP